jgi:hypothetical protein
MAAKSLTDFGWVCEPTEDGGVCEGSASGILRWPAFHSDCC